MNSAWGFASGARHGRRASARARCALLVLGALTASAAPAWADVASPNNVADSPRIVDPRSVPDVALTNDNPPALAFLVNRLNFVAGEYDSTRGANERYSGSFYGASYLTESTFGLQIPTQFVYSNIETISQGTQTLPFDSTHTEESVSIGFVPHLFYLGGGVSDTSTFDNGVTQTTHGTKIGTTLRAGKHLELGYFQGQESLTQIGGSAAVQDHNLYRSVAGYGGSLIFFPHNFIEELDLQYYEVHKDPFQASFGDVDRQTDIARIVYVIFRPYFNIRYNNFDRLVNGVRDSVEIFDLDLDLLNFKKWGLSLEAHSESGHKDNGPHYETSGFGIRIFSLGEIKGVKF